MRDENLLFPICGHWIIVEMGDARVAILFAS